MPKPPGNEADEASPAGTALAPIGRRHRPMSFTTSETESVVTLTGTISQAFCDYKDPPICSAGQELLCADETENVLFVIRNRWHHCKRTHREGRRSQQGENAVIKNLRPLIALLAIGLVIPAAAQVQNAPGGQSAAPAPAADANGRVPYSLGMGEIMVVGVQPRHIRLAAAVRAGDWAYAAYALKELGETWTRIGRAIPKYRGQNTADFVGGFTKDPMNALDAAIKATDAKRFKTAYAQLTQNCNACHQATDRAGVVIKVPTTSDASADQDFKASKP
jgi:hypothetical protein